MPRPSNLRRHLPLWAFGLTLAVLIGGALMGYLNARRLLANERLVARADNAIVDLTRLYSAVRDAERSERGYLLTDSEAHLQRYRDATASIQGEIAALAREFASNPDQRARLVALRREIALKVTQLDRTIALESAGNRAAAVAAVRATLGKHLLDDIGAKVGAMRAAEYAFVARRAAESEHRSRATIAAMVAPALIAAALLGLMFHLGNRRIVELNEADRHKDEFLALLAHELRGPLAPLRNGLQLIRRGDESEEVRRRACALMDRQLEQMSRLVNDLLDASRIARGKVELRKAPLDLGAALRDIVEAEHPLAKASRLELDATLPAEPLVVDGDPVRLTQVFRNLLQNARKYTGPGGRIEVSLAAEHGQAVVRVRDTGLGIPPDKLEAIFEMFAQIESGLAHSQGGLGIGLALARRLLALHGGSIQALSGGRGRGSEFVVRLPLAGTARAESVGVDPEDRAGAELAAIGGRPVEISGSVHEQSRVRVARRRVLPRDA